MSSKKAKTKKPNKNSYHKVSHAHEPISRLVRRLSLYTFFTILTIALSIVIFYRAKGYTFTKSGEVEKRGIVLINSAPVSAKIFIDGKDTGKKTDHKFEINEGNHSLRLEATGYRTWYKDFSIKSEEVEWFYYPYLIPDKLLPKDIQTNLIPKTYSSLNSDGKIIAVSKTGLAKNQSFNFELINLKESEYLKMASPLIVPSQIFSRQTDGSLGTIIFKSWSPNGDSIFLEHNYNSKKEIINLKVDNPTESKNLTVSIGQDISQYRYDDKSRLYLLRGGELAVYNSKNLSKDLVVDTGVLTFNNFKEDKYVYAKSGVNNTGQSVDIYIKDGQNTALKVNTFNSTDPNSLDFQYTINRRTGYLSIANTSLKELVIFKNPLDVASASKGPLFLSTFPEMISGQINESVQGSSQPGSYIALQLSAGSIFIYNFEAEESLKYSQADLNMTKVSWIDSERLQARTSDGKVYYFDYDGNYLNQISSTNQELSFFIKSEDKTIVINADINNKEKISQINFKQ